MLCRTTPSRGPTSVGTALKRPGRRRLTMGGASEQKAESRSPGGQQRGGKEGSSPSAQQKKSVVDTTLHSTQHQQQHHHTAQAFFKLQSHWKKRAESSSADSKRKGENWEVTMHGQTKSPLALQQHMTVLSESLTGAETSGRTSASSRNAISHASCSLEQIYESNSNTKSYSEQDR